MVDQTKIRAAEERNSLSSGARVASSLLKLAFIDIWIDNPANATKCSD